MDAARDISRTSWRARNSVDRRGVGGPPIPRRERPREVRAEGVLHRDRGARPARRFRPEDGSGRARRGPPAPPETGSSTTRAPAVTPIVVFDLPKGGYALTWRQPAADGRAALDRGAAVREPHRGPREGVLRRRSHRGADQRTGPRRRPARRRAHVGVRVQGRCGRRPRDRPASQRLDAGRGQRPLERRPRARDGAAHRRRQRLPPVGPQLRGRRARHPRLPAGAGDPNPRGVAAAHHPERRRAVGGRPADARGLSAVATRTPPLERADGGRHRQGPAASRGARGTVPGLRRPLGRARRVLLHPRARRPVKDDELRRAGAGLQRTGAGPGAEAGRGPRGAGLGPRAVPVRPRGRRAAPQRAPSS